MTETQQGVTSDVREVNDGHEVDRLRMLVAALEARDGCRYALMHIGDGASHQVVVTTSSSVPTDFERLMLATFAKAALDMQAAYQMGRAEGITETARAVYGDDFVGRPDAIRAKHDDAIRHAAHASHSAISLTRIAMAPFGIKDQFAPIEHDGTATMFWAEAKR